MTQPTRAIVVLPPAVGAEMGVTRSAGLARPFTG
jgi:hypothetical protein